MRQVTLTITETITREITLRAKNQEQAKQLIKAGPLAYLGCIVDEHIVKIENQQITIKNKKGTSIMNTKEWLELSKIGNCDYLAQVEDAGFEAGLKGVRLAMAVLSSVPEGTELPKLDEPGNEAIKQAFEYIAIFGNWRELPLPTGIKRALYIRNGEKMEE
jgi:hypothetical protein